MCSGVVRDAATSACAATCPPNTRCMPVSGWRPRKRLRSIVSRSRRSTSSAAVAGIGSSVVVGVEAGEEALELLAELLGGGQLLLLGQRQAALAVGAPERVVLLLQPAHD